MTIFIGNLPLEQPPLAFIELFDNYGKIKQIISPLTHRSLVCNYAFLQLSNTSEESQAISKLNGLHWQGKILTVRQADLAEYTANVRSIPSVIYAPEPYY